MRVAALYDIHGNLPALEAVLEEVLAASVDAVVVGGDVFPGPMGREVLDCLQGLDLPVRFLRGNGDRAVLAVAAGREPDSLPEQHHEAVRWATRQLEREHIQLMESWPATLRLEIEGLGEVLFCHATPRSDTEIFTRKTAADRLVEIFEKPDVPIVVCGHTHMQFDRRIGRARVLNAGSVGMPFGVPGAYWLLLGPNAGMRNVEMRKTSYDLPAAAERIRATDYPQAQTFADRNVLSPPSEQEILELFSGAEIQ